MRWAKLLGMAAVCTTACTSSTTYKPRQTKRAAMTVHEGRVRIVGADFDTQELPEISAGDIAGSSFDGADVTAAVFEHNQKLENPRAISLLVRLGPKLVDARGATLSTDAAERAFATCIDDPSVSSYDPLKVISRTGFVVGLGATSVGGGLLATAFVLPRVRDASLWTIAGGAVLATVSSLVYLAVRESAVTEKLDTINRYNDALEEGCPN